MPNFRIFPDLILLGVSVAAQAILTKLVSSMPEVRKSLIRKRVLGFLTAANIALFTLGYLMVFRRISGHLPVPLATWIQGIALTWAMLVSGLCVATVLWKTVSWFKRGALREKDTQEAEQPSRRRQFLHASQALLFAAPVAATAFGIVRRNNLRMTEVDIRIPNLHKDLDGLRIVQVTDVHLSAFLSEAELAHAIDMANETRPHLALMTGDLITMRGDPLDACLRQLGRLRADAGGLGCLGNHEMYTGTEKYVTEQGRRLGIDFLRKENRELRFGNASINFAGVDYQTTHTPYLVGTQGLVVPGKLNILLSHNPDVFRVAASQGYDLTISGHTHGGQINVEILNDNFNMARYYTPYTRGLYQHGDSQVYVSAGIGTVGMPVRLGAPAEVNLIRLVGSV
jgi:predicted MPP superfamily phosphohydrolase